ncbi:unnamed protein product [Lampetra planeri]
MATAELRLALEWETEAGGFGGGQEMERQIWSLESICTKLGVVRPLEQMKFRSVKRPPWGPLSAALASSVQGAVQLGTGALSRHSLSAALSGGPKQEVLQASWSPASSSNPPPTTTSMTKN